jgi:hypothetical protein
MTPVLATAAFLTVRLLWAVLGTVPEPNVTGCVALLALALAATDVNDNTKRIARKIASILFILLSSMIYITPYLSNLILFL